MRMRPLTEEEKSAVMSDPSTHANFSVGIASPKWRIREALDLRDCVTDMRAQVWVSSMEALAAVLDECRVAAPVVIGRLPMVGGGR